MIWLIVYSIITLKKAYLEAKSMKTDIFSTGEWMVKWLRCSNAVVTIPGAVLILSTLSILIICLVMPCIAINYQNSGFWYVTERGQSWRKRCTGHMARTENFCVFEWWKFRHRDKQNLFKRAQMVWIIRLHGQRFEAVGDTVREWVLKGNNGNLKGVQKSRKDKK